MSGGLCGRRCVDALRSLELSAHAARIHIVGANESARADAERLTTGLLTLRTQLSPAGVQAAAH